MLFTHIVQGLPLLDGHCTDMTSDKLCHLVGLGGLRCNNLLTDSIRCCSSSSNPQLNVRYT